MNNKVDAATLASCLAYLGSVEAAPIAVGSDSEYMESAAHQALTNLCTITEDLGIAELRLRVEDQLPTIAILKNGNCVVPIQVTSEPQGITSLSIFDPLANAQVITISLEKFEAQFSGAIAVPQAPASEKLASPSGSSDHSLFSSLKIELTPILTAGFLINTLSLASPFFLMIVLDKVVAHNAWTTLITLAVGAVALIIFEAMFTYLRSRIVNKLSANFCHSSSNEIFAHTLNAPLPIYQGRPLGAWINENRRPENIAQLLYGQLAMSAVDYLFAIIFLVVLFWLSWQLTCVALAICVFQLAAGTILDPKSKQLRKSLKEHNDRKDMLLVESLTHLRTIRSLGLSAKIAGNFDNILTISSSQRQEIENHNSLLQVLNSLLDRLGNILMLGLGAALIMESSLTVGALVAINILSRRLTSPLIKLPQFLEAAREMAVARQRYPEIFSFNRKIAEETGKKIKIDLVGSIALNGIYYQPVRGSKFQFLAEISIPAGKSVAVVGKSGAGKTTLANLILGLYQPQSGRVTIDGIDLRDLDQEHFRSQVGAASADIMLFRGTIRENICANDLAIDLPRIQAAAKIAQVHEDIQALPLGYETIVGEDASSLSSGQRTRISLARALCRNPKLLLLDEATNDVDLATEANIVNAILSNRKKLTTIFFTHSAYIVQQVDYVVHLSSGRIAGVGKHEELLNNADYRSVWQTTT